MNKSILAILFLFGFMNSYGTCPNLVTNGDFSAGITGFNSTLSPTWTCVATSYWVSNNFQNKCPNWPNFSGNGGGGNFLIIDGSPFVPKIVWSTTVNVTSGTLYEFSFWVASAFSSSLQTFDLGAIINGANVQNFQVSQATPTWQKMSVKWTANTSGNITIAIRQMTRGQYRDFGLDDISFKCGDCESDFSFTNIDGCGEFQFTNQSSGPGSISSFWNFGDGKTSNLDNPSHEFAKCGIYNVCLTVTGNGCSDISCQAVTVKDNTPPVAKCLPGTGIELNANCVATANASFIDDGSFDNCKIKSMSLSPNTFTKCGTFPVKLTVTDWCGNISTCQSMVQTLEAVPPTLSACPSDTIILGAVNSIGLCEADVKIISPIATDNCSPTVTLTNSFNNTANASGTYPNGTTNVTWTAIDDCFNEASCSFSVTVLCDTCCVSWDFFCQNFENAVSITQDPDSCQVTFDIGNLPNCGYIDFIDWGDGHIDTGPFYTGNSITHTYSGNGTFVINWLAVELDENGFICFEKFFSETIDINCSCKCGGFSDMFVRWDRGAPSVPLMCGDSAVTLGCPQPGNSFSFTGLFDCVGNSCAGQAPVNWELKRMPNTSVVSGNTTANPYFGINILPASYSTPGAYELKLEGLCGTDTCVCILNFNIDCPDPCPCNLDEILELNDNVNKGFSIVKSNSACKACFTPNALSDCETVQWHIGSLNNPPIGTSVGNNVFCHQFNNAGTYTVIMRVFRPKADGTMCEQFVKYQTVNLTCTPLPICDNSVFPNPQFNIGAVSGGMNSGGMSEGWMGIWGDPHVKESVEGSTDGWAMELKGNYNEIDAINPIEPLCFQKCGGTIKIRAKATNAKSKPEGRLIFGFDQNSIFEDNLTIASIELSAFEPNEWVDIEIPYNLYNQSNLMQCGAYGNAVVIQPFIYTTNAIGYDQGNEDNRSIVQIDNFCFEGLVLDIENTNRQNSIFAFPNPVFDVLNINLRGVESNIEKIQILNVWGKVVQSEVVSPDVSLHSLSISNLISGAYFVLVYDESGPIWVDRIVKE